MKNIFKIIFNRYFLTITAFFVWIVFFDDSNLFNQIERTNELKALNKKNEYYEEQNLILRSELNKLKKDTATLIKYAREKYFMKKDNEDVYVFDSTATVPTMAN
ncbi:FtsB family cell division protein [Polluticaenibacter yanchengensis]|uniref:Septum formation initiator family protein n=1 Tax=Polluticaenibacter yanchengensis TaxID=3014562 RepID=A0ABT4ULA4_9BACT|nr:septum formation initiator family protein [Chitinophagaceae bacterium LY-5]